MSKLICIAIWLTGVSLQVQAESIKANKLLNPDFWEASRSVEDVKEEIARGSSHSEMNAMDFDATALAINNNASTEVITYLLQQEGNAVTKTTNHLRTYLHWASARGNSAIVKVLIEKGSDVNATDSHGDTPLQFAANFGMTNSAIFELFRKAGVDLKQRTKNGASYAMLGIPYDENLELTDYLISKGLSIYDTDHNGATVFDYAARTGNITTMKALQARGVKATDKALLMAAQGTRRTTNGVGVFQYLIEEVQLQPSVTDAEGNTLLHLIARKANQLPILKYLMSRGLNPTTLNKEGSTMLLVAAGNSDNEVVQFLLASTTDINRANTKGATALTSAVALGSVEIVQMLLNHNADVQVRDNRGNHLGFYLVQSFRPARGAGAAGGANAPDPFTEKMNLLLAAGLDITQSLTDNNSLYHLAAQKEDLELFRKLSVLDININAKNDEAMTVLHKIALTAHNDSLLKYLLTKGAVTTITTEFGETAYDLAAENEYLLANKVDISFLKITQPTRITHTKTPGVGQP